MDVFSFQTSRCIELGKERRGIVGEILFELDTYFLHAFF